MSWTDIFPVFTDAVVEEYSLRASAAERAEMEEFHGVQKVFNPQDKPHIVSFSLFWKNVKACDPDLPVPTRDAMQRARELGLALRFDPWAHYVEPLLREIPNLRKVYPHVCFRVHLASDLEFLIPDLAEAGCEVVWMKGASVRLAPGGLWRYLPIVEEGKLVTLMDVDRIRDVAADIARTEVTSAANLGLWRLPQATDFNPEGEIRYTPFFADRWGTRGGWPVRLLLDAFTWHCRRGSMKFTVEFPGKGPIPAAQPHWPDYGFDEWFLAAALYPRLAAAGVLTLVPASARSLLLTLDIEYVTWANSSSQVVYF